MTSDGASASALVTTADGLSGQYTDGFQCGEPTAKHW